MRLVLPVMGLVVALGLPAAAQDALRMASGQLGNWENQAPILGQEAGIFRKHNLTIETVATRGAGEALQAVIAGSADLGIGVDVADAMRAFSKGAPVRILLPAFTGASDLYWYVKADSPLKTLKDATAQNTMAYSSNGSISGDIVAAFVQELGAKARPTATGGPPGTLTFVLAGQIDIGWAAAPFGLKEIRDGKIRIIARGNDVRSLRGQTSRAVVVNADALANRKDAILRFVRAYREAVEWMYADPRALGMYAAKMKLDEGLLRSSLKSFFPKEAMQTEEMKDIGGVVSDAVKLKILEAPLASERLAEFVQIPARQ
ncbi:MAG: ABC transporter substrate-binding protein [Pseudorhodoplanes sp.]|nr:ABC transporter substrate-binding protein [Pseudorhodoplanes sp.]